MVFVGASADADVGHGAADYVAVVVDAVAVVVVAGDDFVDDSGVDWVAALALYVALCAAQPPGVDA